MTRAQAKQNLIAFGIEEPTEDMISNYLNQVNGEVNPFREKAKTADTLQLQLDEIKNNGLSDLEKANQTIEKSNQMIEQLTKQVNQSEVKAILSGAGLVEDDYRDLIDGIVTSDLESSKARATSLATLLTKQKETVESKLKEELLNNTPAGSGSNPPGGNEKSDAEKLASELVQGKGNEVTQADSIISNYK